MKRPAGEIVRPGPVNYFAAFDCLNKDSPVLIGFVRQPSAQRTNLESLDLFWSGALHRDSESPGGILQNAGFDAVALSVRFRPATPPEIAAYDKLSSTLGGRFCFILKDGRARSPGYHNDLTDVHVMPPELQDATWGGPLIQMLIGSKWRTRNRVRLFDFIREMPLRQRSHVLARLVDLEGLSMHNFAVNAADAMATDVAVLTSGLRDVWQFQADALSWTAQLDAGTWLVRLQGESERLTLQLVVEGSEFLQQLAPYPYSKPLVTRPYLGRLSSLFNLMTHLSVLCRDGRPSFEARFGQASNEPTGPYWYRKLIEQILQGSGKFSELSDFTKWPNLKNKFVQRVHF